VPITVRRPAGSPSRSLLERLRSSSRDARENAVGPPRRTARSPGHWWDILLAPWRARQGQSRGPCRQGYATARSSSWSVSVLGAGRDGVWFCPARCMCVVRGEFRGRQPVSEADICRRRRSGNLVASTSMILGLLTSAACSARAGLAPIDIGSSSPTRTWPPSSTACATIGTGGARCRRRTTANSAAAAPHVGSCLRCGGCPQEMPRQIWNMAGGLRCPVSIMRRASSRWPARTPRARHDAGVADRDPMVRDNLRIDEA